MNTSQENLHASAPPVTPTPSRRRWWWLHGLLALVIFVSGSAVGAGGALLAVRQRVLFALHHPREMPVKIVASMRRPLQLSDEQVHQVELILAERQQQLQAIRRRIQPEVDAELDLVEKQVAEVLDDQQRVQWHERFSRLRGTWVPALPAAP